MKKDRHRWDAPVPQPTGPPPGAFLVSALQSGRLSLSAPFSELAARHPEVWAKALRAFEGSPEAARDWLERPCLLFGGKRPLALLQQPGGRRKVLRELGCYQKIPGQAPLPEKAIRTARKKRS